MVGAPVGFAVAVEPVALSEERWEQLREAQYSLRQWERHRRPDDLARMLAALEALARIVRAS